jgi:hypothetical protein
VARQHRARLSGSDWKLTESSLRAYEAEYLLTSIYSLLAAGERAAAASYLLGSVPLYRHVSPKRLIAGAFYRIFITGEPPEWFSNA